MVADIMPFTPKNLGKYHPRARAFSTEAYAVIEF